MSRVPKVRFVEPQGRRGRPLNAFIGRFPLLGPLQLATVLAERGCDAAVYNENISGPIDANEEAYRDLCSADVVALTIMTPTACRGYAIADKLRRDAPNARIAFGGVHATVLPEEALAHGDIVCVGEGENVIEAIARGEVRSGIVRPEPVADLDSLPTPDYRLMRDLDKLLAWSYKRELYELPLMTSRGCPYGCTYCSVTRMFGRKVRRRSVEKVEEDIRRYVDQGFRFVFFYDDNFLSDRAWAKRLLERTRALKVRFNAQARVDFAWTDASRTTRDEALLRALEKGGCSGLLMGYETIDEGTAKEWHKGYSDTGNGSLVSRLMEDTVVLHHRGIWSYGMFVLGPRHTERTGESILRFARQSRLHSLQVTILTPFPGTALFDQLRPHIFMNRYPEDWDHYDTVHCVYDHSTIGIERLQRLALDLHKRFYRFGGWTGRSIRTVANRPIAFTDKLMDYVSRIRTTHDIFSRWAADNEDYLALVRERVGT